MLREETETCPYCGMENAIQWDVEKNGYEVKCAYCGKKIMLCDACLNSKDNEIQKCDWCETKGCFRMSRNMKRENENYKRLAYELYKIAWIDTHITKMVLLATMKSYIKEKFENYDDNYTFNDYLFDNGFGYGNCYASYDEFLDNEFQDKEFMEELMEDYEGK